MGLISKFVKVLALVALLIGITYPLYIVSQPTLPKIPTSVSVLDITESDVIPAGSVGVTCRDLLGHNYEGIFTPDNISLFGKSPVNFFIARINGNPISINPSFCDLTGVVTSANYTSIIGNSKLSHTNDAVPPGSMLE